MVEHGFCEQHQSRQRELDRRVSSTQRGYDYAWQRLRLFVLRRDRYLCQHCLKQDIVTIATDVDHIIPLSKGGARLEPDNCQSLCRTCHNRKTAKDNS